MITIIQSFAQLFNNKTQGLSIFYGCEKYTEFFHCDRLHNKFESIAITGHSSQLYNVTDTPNFTQGNSDMALLMHATL